ncbi:hypothetical protein GCM10027040_25470 [Halomonas shantousis]
MRLVPLDSLLARLRLYRQRHCSRRQLLSLDVRQLKDIGLSRFDAEQEGRKPFWKA